MADDVVPSGTFGDYSESNSNAESHPSNYEICDRSGFRVKAGGLVKTWDGLMVRPRDWDPRHPQDFVRARPESPRASQRPEPPPIFVVGSLYLSTELDELLDLEVEDGFLLTEDQNTVSVDSL